MDEFQGGELLYFPPHWFIQESIKVCSMLQIKSLEIFKKGPYWIFIERRIFVLEAEG